MAPFPIAEMSLDKIANDPNLISNHKELKKTKWG